MVYFDNAATTRPFDELILEFPQFLSEIYGNPSSLHKLGVDAERVIKDSKKRIAAVINAESDEIFFTSGGTEANNLALIGTAFAHKKEGKKIISTNIEHPSVLSTLQYLNDCGFEIILFDVDKNGEIDYSRLEDEVDENTILVSIMSVNNETGHILDIKKASDISKKKNPKVIFHTDAVQAFLKERIDVKDFDIDILSASAHKIHGLKGVGAIYIKKGTKIRPILFGGEQQNKIRPGTENIAGIFSFYKAIETFTNKVNENPQLINKIKRRFIEGLGSIDDIIINSPVENTTDSILNVSFLGVKSEVLLHVLESNGIFASSGSACSSKGRTYNKVLYNMTHSLEIAKSSIRFSFSVLNTEDEVDYTLEILDSSLKQLRKIMK